MAVAVGFPGQARRRPSGPAAYHDHDRLPIEVARTQPSNDAVTDIEKRQRERGHHHVVDRDRDFGTTDRIEKGFTEVFEGHLAFVGKTSGQKCKRNVARVIDEIHDPRFISGPGLDSDFVGPVGLGIKFAHLYGTFEEALGILLPSDVSELAQSDYPRNGRPKM